MPAMRFKAICFGFLAVLLSSGLARAAEELYIVSPHWEGIRKEFEAAFNAYDKKGVQFHWVDQGGTSDALKFVKTRFDAAPNGIGIDLMWGGGVDPYLELGREKLLVPNTVPTTFLRGIPLKLGSMPLYDSVAGWYGTTLSGFGIFYNKMLVNRLRLPVPRNWADLTLPRLSGKVASADPRHSGTIHLMLELILQGQGWDRGWATLAKLVANLKGFPESSSQAVNEVATGGSLYGMAIDFYAQSQIVEKGVDKLAFVYPSDIRVINPDAMGMLKGAPNPAAARRFMAFVMSPVGQKLWLTPKGRPGGPKNFNLVRHSVRPDLYRGIHFAILQNPFGPALSKGLLHYDAVKGSKRWGILNDLLGVWFIQSHKEWVAAGRSGKLSGALLKAPLSEQALLQLLPKWDDAAFRAATMTQWEKQALSRLRGGP